MVNVFEPALLITGLTGLLVGAGLGEWLSQTLPKYRVLIALALWAPVLVCVVLGLGIRPAVNPPSVVTITTVHAGLFMAVLGLVMGAGIMLMRRNRGQQLYGLVLGSAFGVPLLTNFWMGSAIAQATYGA